MSSIMNDPSDAATSLALELRAFNRFYTQRIGVLDPYLGSELSLTEVRVLYELAQQMDTQSGLTARQLAQQLAIDEGYMSRILRSFTSRKWLRKRASPVDARQQLLSLTAAGHRAFEPLNARSMQAMRALIDPLDAEQRARLQAAMHHLQSLLSAPQAPEQRLVVLRDLQPGDMGWVVQAHGEIYAREYGWNHAFEALVAEIAAGYLKNFKPGRERAWIAEVDGQRAGSVFVVEKSKSVAQLRMLILTPAARGLGLGARLSDEAISFARAQGYQKMVLWTNSCLSAARAIYAKRGFVLTQSEPYTGFGKTDLVSETWELKL
jgi:DNA-binding MarR family transcriptional regulator/ribosomal protein S18 acetylase RimI-like enzyme